MKLWSFIAILLLCTGCGKDDNTTNSLFEGEYFGTYGRAYLSTNNTDEWFKFYSNPTWNSCSATIKIIKVAENQLQFQCISAMRTFDGVYSFIISDDGKISCETTDGYTTISIENGKFSYFYNAHWWNNGIQPGTGSGYVDRVSIQAYQK